MSQTTAYVPTDPAQAAQLHLFSLAALRAVISSPLSSSLTLHTLEHPTFVYKPLSYTTEKSLHPATSASGQPMGNVPTLEEWETLWASWDAVTLRMIPERMLHQKPIDLRHKCLFYIGHIPTFLDMLLHKAIGGGATEPKWFWSIFERGIDPHVDDPDHCHNHSEVPTRDEDWPSLAEVLVFRDGVRDRLRALYADLDSGKRELTRNIARTLVMTHEHEGFHVETLLYMLIQKAGCGDTLPPPGFVVPPWEDLSAQWALNPTPETASILVGPATLFVGQNDSEADDFVASEADDAKRVGVSAKAGHTFGWDNESPARDVQVGAFRASWRCITNAEFAAFWRTSGGAILTPRSWVLLGANKDEVHIRTLFGFVPLRIAADWPVLTSYDDLAAYAKAQGGRLPTEPELRLFLDLYDVGHKGGANVGFRHWHPVPGTMGLDACGGKGSNGGVWEWTSTVFDTHEGLVPTGLFTGYSTDFFDGKHQVSLGASYATIPRLGRRTVRNFYQHNYPYPWISARVVYDV
ncbi:hypothetical protein BDN70DRAFT_972430 [Pholiota conissans]|uniref:DUF323 domain-containing protein n=1 Tax=Pholiota conissans TaxID=109636 RepID=A0A9P6CTI4_9AGAR|nr:hypothetical protein BDN70DRAFT_972430 [Pholiota conissans]